jgi:hypothetical protein
VVGAVGGEDVLPAGETAVIPLVRPVVAPTEAPVAGAADGRPVSTGGMAADVTVGNAALAAIDEPLVWLVGVATAAARTVCGVERPDAVTTPLFRAAAGAAGVASALVAVAVVSAGAVGAVRLAASTAAAPPVTSRLIAGASWSEDSAELLARCSLATLLASVAVVVTVTVCWAGERGTAPLLGRPPCAVCNVITAPAVPRESVVTVSVAAPAVATADGAATAALPPALTCVDGGLATATG